MGHQVNFYITPADVSDVERKLAALAPMVMLHSRSPTAEPRIVSSLNSTDGQQRWLFYFLVRAEDVVNVVSEHVPAQGYWTIDVLRSPVVEFNSCFFDGSVLRRGRMYYVDGSYAADGTWVEKPEGFRTWAKALLSTAKRSLEKHGPDYLGEDAAAWLHRENGKLVT